MIAPGSRVHSLWNRAALVVTAGVSAQASLAAIEGAPGPADHARAVALRARIDRAAFLYGFHLARIAMTRATCRDGLALKCELIRALQAMPDEPGGIRAQAVPMFHESIVADIEAGAPFAVPGPDSLGATFALLNAGPRARHRLH